MKSIQCTIIALLCSLLTHAQHNITEYNISLPYGVEVNTHNGNLFYQQNDLSIPGIGMDISLTFSYNSIRGNTNMGCGKGWTTNYGMMYNINPSTGEYTLERSDGQRHKFTLNGANFDSPTGNFETFSEYAPARFLLTMRDGIKYYFDDASHRKLTKIEDRNGNTCDFTYNANGELTQVTSSCGANISMTWSGGYMTEVQDATELPVRLYEYEYTGDLLTKYTDPEGYSEEYEYNNKGKMTKLTNKRGHTLDLTYNAYGAVASAVSPLSSCTVDYDMDAMTTTVTEPVGGTMQSTTYQYNAQKQLLQKIGNCCGFNVQYTYDSDNNITQMIDANGHPTFYDYNSMGQVTKETDALGNFIEYSYGTPFNLVTSMTDKNGVTYTYTYDANGNLITSTNPIFSENYTYNTDGTRATHTDGNGNLRTYTYDACGQLEAINEPLGRTTTYAYNNRGELITETDANGCPTTYTYDGLSRVLDMINPFNDTMSYSYDGNGNRISMTDENRNPSTEYDYDALDRMIAIRQPEGINSSYIYNEKNRISMTDPNGNTTIYQYNTRNLLTSQTDAENITVQYDYDLKGNRILFIDGNGNQYTYEYDDIDQMTKSINPYNDFRLMEYDPNGNQIKMIDEEGNATEMMYDDINRLVEILDAENYTTEFIFDNNNNQIQVIDANDNPTFYRYDALNRLVETEDALTFKMTYTYDLEGNQLTATDANNNSIYNEYDCLNRLIESKNDLDETTLFAYDANSNQSQVTYPNGNVVSYTYDAVDRVTEVNDGIGLVMQYEYDFNSNIIAQTDGNDNTISMQYDGINRMTVQIDALMEKDSFVYDLNSNLTRQIDREGNATHFEYDLLDRRILTTDAMDFETIAEYDKVGNLTQLIDDKNNSTIYEYDNLYRNTKEIFADSTDKIYSYDGVGNMLSRQDNNDDVTAYTYDQIYRLTGRDYPDTNDDIFVYDDGRRMISATNNNATIAYTYDQANRILSETLNGQSTLYGYDIPNNIRTLTYPGGRTITENYDLRSRLDNIANGGGNIAEFDYDTGNRMTTKTYGNGTTSQMTYNDNNWLTRLTHNNGTDFADFEYEHDKVGNKKYEAHLHAPDRSEQYEYDDIYRLTVYKKGTLAADNIPMPTVNTQYGMDALGNRTTVTDINGNTTNYTADAMNQYTQITGINPDPEYDNNGNTLFDGNNQYDYDTENRLLGTGNIMYSYDPFGRRIQKDIGGTLTRYYFDGARVLEEQDGNQNTAATYVYGTWIDDIITMQRGAVTHYHHHNALGSVIALTDANANLTERYEYDAYGTPDFLDANYNPLPYTSANPYLFTGRRWDTETQLYYYRARYYNPTLGRFMQRDPLGYVDGMNLMEYVGGNVVNWVDPFGLQRCDIKILVTENEINMHGVFNKLMGIISYETIYASNGGVEISRNSVKIKKNLDEVSLDGTDVLEAVNVSAIGQNFKLLTLKYDVNIEQIGDTELFYIKDALKIGIKFKNLCEYEKEQPFEIKKYRITYTIKPYWIGVGVSLPIGKFTGLDLMQFDGIRLGKEIKITKDITVRGKTCAALKKMQ